MMKPEAARAWKIVRWLVPPLIVTAAAAMLWHQLHDMSLQQLDLAIRDLSLPSLLVCAAGTGVSFLCLGLIECVAVRDVLRIDVPARTAARVGAISHALSNTLGFHAITASVARYRGYRAFRLSAVVIAKLLGIVGGSLVVGAILLALAAFLGLRLDMLAKLGIGTLLVLAALSWALRRHRTTLGPGRRGAWIMAKLGSLALGEAAVATIALYVLLPAGVTPGFAHFALAFLGASALGVASHSPGGVGVFEAAMLAALPDTDTSTLLVALLAFRVIYNLVPFSIAALTVMLGPRTAYVVADQLEGG